MNQNRRKRLDQIIGVLEGALADLEVVKDEEQEAFDNLPENMQEGDRGTAMQEAIDALDDAFNNIEAAKDQIDNIVNA